jgi:hypothetical protein
MQWKDGHNFLTTMPFVERVILPPVKSAIVGKYTKKLNSNINLYKKELFF